MKKFYRILIPLLLIVFAVTWIHFLDQLEDMERDKYSNSSEAKPTEAVDPSLTPSPIPSPTPAPEPSPTPRPTIEPQPTSTPTPIPSPTEIPEPTVIFGYCTTKTSDSVIIYSGASEQYSEAGLLSGFDVAKVVERGDDWIKINYNGITGYCMKSQLDMDDNAIKTFREMGGMKIKVTGNNVNIRSEANTSCEVVGKASVNEQYDYLPEYDEDGFYAISYQGNTRFVSKDFANFTVIK